MAVVVTFSVAYSLTRNLDLSLKIIIIESFIKILLYYLHEKYWEHDKKKK